MAEGTINSPPFPDGSLTAMKDLIDSAAADKSLITATEARTQGEANKATAEYTGDKKILVDLIKDRIITGGLEHETIEEFNARQILNGVDKTKIKNEPTTMKFMADMAMTKTDGTTPQASEAAKDAHDLRVDTVAYYENLLKSRQVIENLDSRQVQTLIDQPQALEKMLTKGELPKPRDDNYSETLITSLPFTVQDAAYVSLSDQMLEGTLADKYLINPILHWVKDKLPESWQQKLSEVKKDLPYTSVFEYSRQKFLDGVRDDIIENKAPFTDQQTQNFLNQLKTELPSADSYNESAIRKFVAALPIEKNGEPVPDRLIRLDMEAGFNSKFKDGLKPGAPVEDQFLAIYHKYKPDQNLIDNTVIKLNDFFDAVGQHFKLSDTQVGILKAEGTAGDNLSRKQQEAVLEEFVHQKTGKPLPLHLSELKLGQGPGGEARILEYIKNKYGTIGPDGKRELPAGASWEQLRALGKKPDLGAKLGFFFNHLDHFSEMIDPDAETKSKNNPAIRIAEALEKFQNSPQRAILNQADKLQHSPATKFLEALQKKSNGMKPVNGEIDLGPQLVEEFVKHVRADNISSNKGTLSPGGEKVLAELAKMTPAQLAAITQKGLGQKFAEATILEQTGYTTPSVQIASNASIVSTVDAQAAKEKRAVSKATNETTAPKAVQRRQRNHRSQLFADASAPHSDAAEHDPKLETVAKSNGTSSRRKLHRHHHHDAHPTVGNSHSGHQNPDQLNEFKERMKAFVDKFQMHR